MGFIVVYKATYNWGAHPAIVWEHYENGIRGVESLGPKQKSMDYNGLDIHWGYIMGICS